MGRVVEWGGRLKNEDAVIITNSNISENDLLEKTFQKKEGKEIILREAKSREEKSLTALAEKKC